MTCKFVDTHVFFLVQVVFCLICAAGEQRLSALHHVLLGCISTNLLLELIYSGRLIVFFISIRVGPLCNIERVIVNFHLLSPQVQFCLLSLGTANVH